jgi:hypothetical protein
VDRSPGELAEVLERVGRVPLHVLEHRRRTVGIAGGQLLCETHLHTQRDQLLLGAVVQVPLQSAASLVLCRDEALPRRLELFDQPNVAEHIDVPPGRA